MKYAFLATSGLLALAITQAGAADLPRRTDAAPPAPIYSPAPIFTWTGFYVGLNTGYGFGKFTGGGDTLFGKAHGGLVGGTVGYNQQFGSIVLGVEGDWDWSGVKGSNTLAGPVFGSAKLTNLATARIRAGYSIDKALLYVTGGYAGGTISGSLNDTTIPRNFSSSNWNNGYAVGAGVEYAFSKNISVKAEYLYANLATKPVFAAPDLSNAGVHQNLLRAGVNYRF